SNDCATWRSSGVSSLINCRAAALGNSSSSAVRSSGDISFKIPTTCSWAIPRNNFCCASTSRYSKTSAASADGRMRKMMTWSSSSMSRITSATSAGGHSRNISRNAPKLRVSIKPLISGTNIFDAATMSELSEHVDAIERDNSVRGLIITSAKRSIFVAGADLKTLLKQAQTGELRDFIAKGQRVFNRIAGLKIPSVAAVHGACAGGGYEITLACDWRVASDDPATRIGLPETTLGLIPAWGGSTRLPRLIGEDNAAEVIL